MLVGRRGANKGGCRGVAGRMIENQDNVGSLKPQKE